MSIRAMSWAWEQTTASPSERLVLLALCDHAGDDGTCWPTTGRLAEKCGMTKQTVKRHLTALDGRGLIVKLERRTRPDGGLGGWLYQIAYTVGGITDDTREVSPMIPGGYYQQCLGGITDDASYKEPSVEPSVEPSIRAHDGFDLFWAAYPRKVAKPDAQKAWKQVTKKHDPQVILAGLETYGFSSDGRFVPYPATWLRRERWLDEGAAVVLSAVEQMRKELQ